MSIFFLLVFLAIWLSGQLDAISNEYLYIWALFSIADATWARVLFKK